MEVWIGAALPALRAFFKPAFELREAHRLWRRPHSRSSLIEIGEVAVVVFHDGSVLLAAIYRGCYVFVAGNRQIDFQMRTVTFVRLLASTLAQSEPHVFVYNSPHTHLEITQTMPQRVTIRANWPNKEYIKVIAPVRQSADCSRITEQLQFNITKPPAHGVLCYREEIRPVEKSRPTSDACVGTITPAREVYYRPYRLYVGTDSFAFSYLGATKLLDGTVEEEIRVDPPGEPRPPGEPDVNQAPGLMSKCSEPLM
ncbi:hypothetical protein [Methylocapsa sp. S129]|uniref:hypothetical protein n=1 Tax=Methylocapsa sp. S129 TaxID=1641869 RepID=UPI00131A6EC3|nr:hypothetical protein [Methylocapsa sp. S129]